MDLKSKETIWCTSWSKSMALHKKKFNPLFRFEDPPKFYFIFANFEKCVWRNSVILWTFTPYTDKMHQKSCTCILCITQNFYRDIWIFCFQHSSLNSESWICFFFFLTIFSLQITPTEIKRITPWLPEMFVFWHGVFFCVSENCAWVSTFVIKVVDKTVIIRYSSGPIGNVFWCNNSVFNVQYQVSTSRWT